MESIVTYFEPFLWGWIILAILVFLLLQWVTAPFGRHTSNNWGPTINNRWAWVLMELPSLLIFALLFLKGLSLKTEVMWVFFAAWTLHYFHRSIIYPFRQRDTEKRMPFVILLSAVFFNLVNAGTNGFYLGFLAEGYGSSWWFDPRFIVGLSLFILGFIINWQSDNILLNLRKPGETGYKIPRGGMFKWVSCPNHFGEIIEWLGFAVMTWSLAGAAFAIWTAANLIPRAVAHHKWYLEKFKDYPKERKAVLPFIY